ncbi:MAG: NAD-binding protein, partial [Planctomycetota bacterium]
EEIMACGVVFVFAAAGHYLLTDGSLLDSIYWTVITVSTVGYAHRTPAGVGPLEQIFTIVVIIVGTIAVGYTLGMFLQVAIEGQIERAMGVRRMNREISRLNEHVIICGFGRIGQYLAESLDRQQMQFVVIETNAEAAAEAKEEDYLCIEGDATEEEVLWVAGVHRARTVVVALHSDADNVFLTLTARNMNPELNILARGEQPATEKKLLQAGANQVVLPAVIGAHQMSDLILRPNAASFIYGVGRHPSLDAEMEELQITASSALVGQTIRNAGTRKKDAVLIVSVHRQEGEQIFNPDADFEFHAGDTLVVIGKTAAVREFRKTYGMSDEAKVEAGRFPLPAASSDKTSPPNA